jgi:uncharacterized protein (UPF0332 family)
MLDNKKIEEIKKRVKTFIDEGIISKSKDKNHVDFFIDNSRDSLDSADVLFRLSTEESSRESMGLESLNGFLWVINASYYSMFYLARALLENEGVKLKAEQSIHALAFDALVYYFFLNGKLQKRLIDDLEDAKEEASQLLGQKKAKELIDNYMSEKSKRAAFTYETGIRAMEAKAKTSLERAKTFSSEINRIIKRQ